MNIEEIKEEYLSEIEKANSLDEVNEIKNKYLSKKGKVSELMGKMKDIVAEKKASYGQAVNTLKTIANVIPALTLLNIPVNIPKKFVSTALL